MNSENKTSQLEVGLAETMKRERVRKRERKTVRMRGSEKESEVEKK